MDLYLLYLPTLSLSVACTIGDLDEFIKLLLTGKITQTLHVQQSRCAIASLTALSYQDHLYVVVFLLIYSLADGQY